MLKKTLSIFILGFIYILPQSFEASVPNTTVGLNDRFQISFVFSGKDVNGLKDFSPPDFNKNFLVLSGPNQSTSMQFINGVGSASLSYTYYLQPRNTGKFTIGAASINYDGTSYNTSPITMEVTKGSSSPNLQTQSSDNVPTKEIAENLFVRATADKQKVYKGEQVVVTYKLYTRLNIAAQMSISKLPQYQGFWAEELETSPNIMFTTEVVNGKQYRVGILKKAALFPTQSGELSVTPFELNVPVQIRKKSTNSGRGDIFDQFFNDPFFGRSETVEYTAKSNTLKLNVLPLPDANVPESFNGAVGRYDISSKLGQKKFKTNEPVSIKLTLSGRGNIKLVETPKLDLPTGFESYDPKVEEEINRTSTVSGKKEIEYLIIPRIAGTKEISPIEFSYFDPAKKSYITLSTQSYTLNIEQGTITPDVVSGKGDIKTLGNDIRFIKTSTELSKKSEPMIFKVEFWTAVAFPLFALIGLVGWKKKTDRLYANVELLKYQKAQKIARNRLKTAKSLMSSENHEIFYTEISLALFGYLEDKLNIPKSEFTLEKAEEKLRQNNVDDKLISDLKNCAEKCEYIRFAPSGNGQAAMEGMYNESANVIIGIERSLSWRKN